jgi:hypothetical protein
MVHLLTGEREEEAVSHVAHRRRVKKVDGDTWTPRHDDDLHGTEEG